MAEPGTFLRRLLAPSGDGQLPSDYTAQHPRIQPATFTLVAVETKNLTIYNYYRSIFSCTGRISFRYSANRWQDGPVFTAWIYQQLEKLGKPLNMY
jgi:hypothetical protein